jgi:hypothetical protein
MDKSGIIGEISESLGSVVKQTVKQVAKTPVDLTKTAAQQIKGDIGAAETLNSSAGSGNNQSSAGDTQTGDKKLDREIKDKEALAKVRSQLHSIYYQNLVDPKKPQEESVTEKLEKEDKATRQQDLQTQANKPPPLPQNVKQGTGEKVVGISG